MLMLSAPASAARLQSWRFDAGRNQLEIKTTGDVQPQAQLIFNPTRLVIDLPGTVLGQSPVTQTMEGTIRAIRVAQFDPETTRLVLELSPGYTLDPNQVKFTGITGSSWSVQLPQPQLSSQAPRNEEIYNVNLITANNSTTASKLTPINTTANKLTPINTTVRTINPIVNPVNRLNTTVRTINPIVNPVNRPNATVRAINPIVNTSSLAQADTSFVSTIESIQLSPNGTQLVIRGDRNLMANGGWDRTTGLYKIVIPNAQLASRVTGPQLNADSPILRIRLQQQDSRTVIVLVQPASGVAIGRLNQIGDRFVSLNLQRASIARNPISQPIFDLTPPPPASQPQPGAIVNQPSSQPSRPIPKGRIVIMVDPGHGGKDSGAPGLGGLLEKDVILPISKTVAAVLEKNGIQAILTRNADYFVTLQGRVDMSEQANANLFVSIHANSVDNRPDVNGLETYYYENGANLAKAVHRRILGSIDNLNDRGVRQARFYVLRKNSMPAILVETGFMTGARDNPRLGNPEYQRRMGEAIANGILDYLRQR
jgi:N-acetylmuramoyl-L-alanine amidase